MAIEAHEVTAPSPAHPPQTLREVPVAHIDRSPTNPRKRFADIESLAESIHQAGVLQEPVVRSHPQQPGRYELVLGERRLRAVTHLGWTTLWVKVRELTDREVLRAQLTENRDRDDMLPLEEAEGYDLYRRTYGLSDEDLALELGVKPYRLSTRLKLLDLVPRARELLNADVIPFTGALRIARLRPEHQVLLLETIASQPGTKWSAERIAEEIGEHYHLPLYPAPGWSLDAVDVAPGLRACTGCPDREGRQVELFGDGTPEQCLKPPCYNAKRDAIAARDQAARITEAARLTDELLGPETGETTTAPPRPELPVSEGSIQKAPGVKIAPPEVQTERAAEALVLAANARIVTLLGKRVEKRPMSKEWALLSVGLELAKLSPEELLALARVRGIRDGNNTRGALLKFAAELGSNALRGLLIQAQVASSLVPGSVDDGPLERTAHAYKISTAAIRQEVQDGPKKGAKGAAKAKRTPRGEALPRDPRAELDDLERRIRAMGPAIDWTLLEQVHALARAHTPSAADALRLLWSERLAELSPPPVEGGPELFEGRIARKQFDQAEGSTLRALDDALWAAYTAAEIETLHAQWDVGEEYAFTPRPLPAAQREPLRRAGHLHNILVSFHRVAPNRKLYDTLAERIETAVTPGGLQLTWTEVLSRHGARELSDVERTGLQGLYDVRKGRLGDRDTKPAKGAAQRGRGR
jgi:ParB/RepB/Spo0J family partition protein